MQSNKKSIVDRLLRSSTRAFFKEWKRSDALSLYDLLHGYVYGRWPYLYIGIGTGEHPIAKWYNRIRRALNKNNAPSNGAQKPAHDPKAHRADLPSHTFADGYHGKVVPLKAATQLVSVNEPVRLTNLEQVIPYTRARDLVLHNPDHIVVLDCPCRSSRQDPCLPLDVCLIVGEPFASFVSDNHPNHSRWITSQEAVGILKAEDERGHVHHAFFKDAMLGRFYAICNCCQCCCGAMNAQRNGTPMLAASGYVSRVDEELCIGCGSCEETCQFNAIALEPDTGCAVVSDQDCMGCGICVEHCSEGALTLVRDDAKGEPLEIFNLMQQASEAQPAAARIQPQTFGDC